MFEEFEIEKKDDFDLFIEEVEEVIRLHEAGYNVENKYEQLRRRARFIDPSNIPSTSADPSAIIDMVTENIKSKKTLTQDLRHQRKIRILNANNSKDNISDSPTKTNTRSVPCGIILILLISFFCLVFYLRAPPPCPRPIW
ncbi:unnamed protein product [Caenorhabditis brenneri]